MIFDSHTHLNLAAFDLDREELIKKYLKEGIFLINVGTCYETSLKAVKLAEKYDNCWASVGIHPSHTFPFRKDDLEISSPYSLEEDFDEKFISLLNSKKVIAVGECGLDDSYLKDFSKEKQKEYQEKEKKTFIKQIKIAKKKKLPIIFHIRDLYLEALDILEKEKFDGEGVFHFFTGSLKDAKAILNKGYYLGFSGVITYSDKLDEVIKYTPLDKILIETDAPYVAPVPYRGKRNEPKYVIEVIKKIAEIKKLNSSQIEEFTFNNAKKLFRLKI
ncbi:MAG: TatD family hydrolase [Minisyncoccia bacterium]